MLRKTRTKPRRKGPPAPRIKPGREEDPERLAMSISHSIVRLAKNPQTALGFPTFQHA